MADIERTKGIYIYTPPDGNDRVEVLRHVTRDAAGVRVELPGSEVRVNNNLSELADYEIPGGPVTITSLVDVRALLKRIADDLAAKNAAVRAAARAQAAAEDGTPSE